MATGRPLSIGERVASLALLVALVALAAILVTRGPHYPPQEQPPAVAEEGERSPPKAATPGEGSVPEAIAGAPGESAASGSVVASPDFETLLPPAVAGTALERDGELEFYPEDRLFEKIDGADERYKLYGARQLVYASYIVAGRPSDRVDVCIYEMRSPLAALGIFGRERSPGAAVDRTIGAAGYRIEGSAFFRKGVFYVQIRGYVESAKETVEKLARRLAEGLPAEPALETDFSFLPAEGRVPGSERFEPKDAVLGTGFLENVFSAEYAAGEAGAPSPVIILFAANCGDPSAAARAAARYTEHLRRRGKPLKQEQIDAAAVTFMDLDGLFEGFWTAGDVFAGVAEARNQTTLKKYAAALVRSLQGTTVPRVGEARPASAAR